MQRPQGRRAGGASGLPWPTAAALALVQLFTVLTVYALHCGVAAGGGSPAEAAAVGPSQQAEAPLWDRPPAAPRSVRLADADLDLLRTEISAMVASLPASRAQGGGGEAGAAAPPLPGAGRPELPPEDPQVPRLVDEMHAKNPASNIPGVEDLHAELRQYAAAILGSWVPTLAAAAARQRRPSAKEVGMDVEDYVDELESLPARIEHLNEVVAAVAARGPPARVAVATTSSADLWALRREVLPWLTYHTDQGVARFFVLYDGSDPDAVAALQAVRHVELIHIHPPWARAVETVMWEAQHNLTRRWVWAGGGGVAPGVAAGGNYELMAKQAFCLTEALRRAKSAGNIDWMMHLDPDELFLPGGRAGGLAAELAAQPPSVPAVRFLNFEGQPEAGDAANRFEQVTLFRAHKHFITPEAHWYRNRFKLGENAAFLYLYANGKSAVRVDAPGARHSGPHYFTGEASPRWATAANPSGAWWNAVSDASVVLHYAYASPGDVAAKAHRSCPGEAAAAAAAAGDRAAVKDACFVIDFDVDAFMAAVKGPEAVLDFFYTRQVLSEGSPVRCVAAGGAERGREGWCALADVDRFIFLMEKLGLMRRVLAPREAMRQHERAVQRLLARQPERAGALT